MGDGVPVVKQVGKVVPLASLGQDVQQLIERSIAVRQKAYCKYSNYQVGSAILCDDGTIVDGCNVETGAPGTICAERTALVKAVSEGRKKFIKLAVVARKMGAFTAPCGSCRQFIVEFALRDRINTEIYLADPDEEPKTVLVTNITELLPLHFELKDN